MYRANWLLSQKNRVTYIIMITVHVAAVYHNIICAVCVVVGIELPHSLATAAPQDSCSDVSFMCTQREQLADESEDSESDAYDEIDDLRAAYSTPRNVVCQLLWIQTFGM